MGNVVFLKDYKEVALKSALETNKKRLMDSEHHYSDSNIKTAVEELAKHNLKYNIEKGKTYLGRELLAEYSYKSDIPTYDNEIDVVTGQFINFIMNSAGRLQRGYSVI